MDTISSFNFVDTVILPVLKPYFNTKYETDSCFCATFSCISGNVIVGYANADAITRALIIQAQQYGCPQMVILTYFRERINAKKYCEYISMWKLRCCCQDR